MGMLAVRGKREATLEVLLEVQRDRLPCRRKRLVGCCSRGEDAGHGGDQGSCLPRVWDQHHGIGEVVRHVASSLCQGRRALGVVEPPEVIAPPKQMDRRLPTFRSRKRCYPRWEPQSRRSL